MAIAYPAELLRRLLQEASESEWLEFKHNNTDTELIGRTVAACANSAMLRDRALAVWGGKT